MLINMVLVAIAPSIGLLIFIYQKDRYDREPSVLLMKLFIFGAISVIPVYVIERFISHFNIYRSALYEAFIVAGLTEEFFKFTVVKKASFFSRWYNEKLDGIIYSVFTSLGFATVENLLYIFNSRTSYIYTGLTRALISVPSHMLFAVTMGYYLSLAKFSASKYIYRSNMIKALIVPVFLHGIFDYILISQMYGYMIFFAVFVIYLWTASLKRLNSYVEDSRRGSDKNRETQ